MREAYSDQPELFTPGRWPLVAIQYSKVYANSRNEPVFTASVVDVIYDDPIEVSVTTSHHKFSDFDRFVFYIDDKSSLSPKAEFHLSYKKDYTSPHLQVFDVTRRTKYLGELELTREEMKGFQLDNGLDHPSDREYSNFRKIIDSFFESMKSQYEQNS